MKNENVWILNFTDVYKKEHFYEQYPYVWIDCSQIRGTYGYCDGDATRQLQDKIRNFSPYGIHYIDSGNYHYMSKLFTDDIKEPFTLIVLDHHPDMQPPLFQGLLSCGCWLQSVMDCNPFIKKIVLLGPDETLLSSSSSSYKEKIHIYSQQTLMQKEFSCTLQQEVIEGPVYISMDKDVLSTSDAITDWNQGPFSLSWVLHLINDFIGQNEIIGVDICGELPRSNSDRKSYHATLVNDHTNLELLHTLYRRAS